MLKALCNSRTGVRHGKLPIVRRTLFCRRCNFNRWESAANSRGIVPSIYNLGAGRRRVVTFTPLRLHPSRKSRRYPLDRRLGGPQSRSWRCGEQEVLLLLPRIETWFSDRAANSLVTIPTELSRLHSRLYTQLDTCYIVHTWTGTCDLAGGLCRCLYGNKKCFMQNRRVRGRDLVHSASLFQLPGTNFKRYINTETCEALFFPNVVRAIITRLAISMACLRHLLAGSQAGPVVVATHLSCWDFSPSIESMLMHSFLLNVS
jgi:hypothetical protein